MNPLMNLYMRQMAARGGRMAFQGGGMDAGASSPSGDMGAGAGVSAGVAAGMGRGPQQGERANLKQDPTTDTTEDDKDKRGFLDATKDVSKFAFNPVLGLVSMATGLPIGLGLGIANALGVEMGPPADTDPDRGGRADERMIAQIPQQTVPVQLFGGDTVKLQRYEDFMKAGYPPDMAEYLVNQLA